MYQPPPCPVAVVCIDGCADDYLNAALVLGRMPRLAAMLSSGGFRGQARAALPTFTNVNNACIATGVAPSQHGISGNFFLDPSTGQEVMMNDARYLYKETIFAEAARAKRRVAIVTAKEKLRDILAKGLSGIAFSAEKADQAVVATHGIDDVEALVGRPTPPIYSADASLFVMAAGTAMLKENLADLLYLSLTDYIQHKFAPGEEGALDFYEKLDHEIGALEDAGAVLAMTADHGMNAKQKTNGHPDVIFLESVLAEKFDPECRVILPITDPYVVHHGSLGSCAYVHLPQGLDIVDVGSWILGLDGVTEVLARDMAAAKMELPPDRIGDLVVMAGRRTVLGRTPDYHDLSLVASGLRSHGGRYEEMVPLMFSKPLTPEYARLASGDPRNYDVFDFALNGLNIAQEPQH